MQVFAHLPIVMSPAQPSDVSPAAHNGAIRIRTATTADLPAIVAIYAHHVRTGTASFEIDPPDAAEMTRRYQTLHHAGMPYIVAEAAGGEVLGYAYAGPHRARPAYRHTVEDSIYLHTDAQGRGVGTLLLQALIAECQARGFKQMVAVVGGGLENAGSARLHARCGFREVGVLQAVGYKFGRWLDCLLMQRTLEDPPPSQ
ncbi:Phosphinothricin N-acetyltransferase [Ralstonia mannitolilytica]|uniref:Phosphinothricin N-acetyltransferase n=2 Tax=Ralstonia mannitolilytica TaxID=105219 RepID=A0AAJ4ZQM7_9RALS|nr:L-methionine sulfoximine/L-methionine sulfone acetyltransferase [Ralstonia mannitolilytica]CAJ0729723.1 L-methionine sulfoximine/L-methionine sulfone acetyltransferase [Ralstonia mannitolilytica]SUE25086.1 Phosphinothricin N-acetyltransferase [Ralstonia mannitolilytica]SUE26219.1 Phosphinothricin N-acetyltransferase [Ralstonia mannitolilytica]SUE36030.1 Phosphinothricin N-acetyltransferase [Ralstonia mannitolilytica]